MRGASCMEPAPDLRLPVRVPHQINFPRSPGPILASKEDGGRLGNYGDPGAAMSDPKWFVRRLASPAFGFNGRRDERPNRNAFTSLMTARRIIEACDDNLVRSHSSFGRLCFAQHVNRLVRGNGRTA
jgi:hypothetical protein